MSSYNEVRMTPRATRNQILLSSSISISPRSTLYSYYDYFSTYVTAFDLHKRHDYLEILANSHVEIFAYSDIDAPCEWGLLGSEIILDDFAEYLMLGAYTEITDETYGVTRDLIRSAPTPQLGLHNALEWIASSMEYGRGITHVQTSAQDALAVKVGVCQDFSHVAIAALRAGGIPARYVSGYLSPGSTENVGEAAVGESHAWIEAWLGNWIGIDPSNQVNRIDERYVAVAKGRDYGDVTPFSGIYFGGSSSPPMVTVTITRRQ